MLEHRCALRVVEAGEVQVGGLVAVVGARCGGTGASPIHLAVLVIQALDQHLQEALVGLRRWVVVTHLAQGHVHGGVLRAHLELFVLHDFGDLGGFPGHYRHIHRAGRHLLVTHHGGDGFGHGGVTLHRHRARTRHRRIGVQGHVATGADLDAAAGCRQVALPADDDAATDQRRFGNVGFQALAAPGHVHTRVEVDVAVGTDEAAGNGQTFADVEQNAAIGGAFAFHAGGHDAVHRGHGGQQVHQLVGQDQRVVGVLRRHRVAAGHFQAAAGLQEHRGIHTGGVDVAARQHADVVGAHLHLIAHVDVAVDEDVFVGRNQAQQTNLGFAQVALTQHAFDEDAVGGRDLDRAASGRVQGTARDVLVAAVEHQRFHQHRHTALVGAGADAQLVVGRNEAVHQHLRTAGDGDISAGICRADFAAQPDVAVAGERNRTIGAHVGLAPGATAGFEAGGGIGQDRTAGRHGHAHAAGVGTGVDGDVPGGQEVTAHGGVAQREAFSGVHVDGGALTGPAHRLGEGIHRCTATQAAQHGDAVAQQLDAAVVRFAVQHRVLADQQVVARGQGEQRVGRQHHTATAVHRAQAEAALGAELQALRGC